MRERMLVKLSNWFLCLAVTFLMLSSPLAGKAQGISVVNVAGTAWDTGPVVIPTLNKDDSVTTRRCLYNFDKQGKVESTVSIAKSAGVEFKYAYNPDKDRYEYRYVPTLPEANSKVLNGTYEINGKSIYLDFRNHIINATIYGDSMKGTLTYKGTNEKEGWVIWKISGSITSTSDVEDSLPSDVIRGADGKLKPASGYVWVSDDPKDFRVKLMPGLIKTEDGFRPAKGYRWVNPKDPKDFRVEPIP